MTLSASSILCLAGLHFLWQGVAIAAVAWLVGAVARRFSSQSQYLALVAGLTAMPLVFAGTAAWLYSSTPASLAAVASAAHPLEVAPYAGETRPLFLLAGSSPAQPAFAAASLWQQSAPWLATAYWLAVAGMSLRLLLGLGGARRLVRESASVSDKRLLQFVADQCQLLGIQTVPLVAYCRDVAVPTVIGVLRPTILLPLAATTAMTSEEIETILTHELVHIRRHDQLLVLWQRIVEILFFFHPAVWLLSRRISDVREHCCDDRVIALGIEPQVYVESLLRAAELSLFGPTVKPMSALAVALSAVDQPSRLRERILRLVDRPALAPLKLRPAALAIALGVLLVTLAAPFALQSLAQTTETKAAEKNSTEKNPAEESNDAPVAQLRSGPAELIDALIQREIMDANARQNPAANPHTFIRRIFLDLVGRPPTAEELRDWTARFSSELAGDVLADGKEDRIALQTIFGDRAAILGEGLISEGSAEPRASDYRAQFGSQFELNVTGRTEGPVWGTDVYTDDSDLGAAAVHAGLVRAGEQATVILTIVKSPARHVGSTRNGVTSSDYGTFVGSFMLHKSPEQGRFTAVRRPRTTAGEMNQALGVWENLIKQNQAEAQRQAARAQAALADQDLAQARSRLRKFIEESPNATVDLTEIHRLRTTDCRKCHQAVGEADSTGHAHQLTNATSFRGKLGRQFDVEIVGITNGSVWGTDVYTDDTNIAAAAVHAGIVRAGERAIVTVTIVESPAEHVASERNGVSSGAWGSSPTSYILMRKSEVARTKPRPPSPTTASGFSGKLGKRFDVEVIGQTEGNVWGTDVYTDDSHIATAAVHAGLVKPGERAIVTLTIVESPDHHGGSTRHGITTQNYGSYHSSFILQRKPEDPAEGKPIRLFAPSIR